MNTGNKGLFHDFRFANRDALQEEGEIGGQAILDGVMLRRGRRISMAVKPGDRIIVKTAELPDRLPVFSNLPVIRGIIALYESVMLGIRSFAFSADVSAQEQGEDHAPLSRMELIFTLFVAFGTGTVLFILLPSVIAHASTIGSTDIAESSGTIYSILESSVRLLIFLMYVGLISKTRDVKRIFEYHGAEHKVVAAWETMKDKLIQSNPEIQVTNSRTFSRFHARCGTSFLMIALIVSSVVFSFFPVGTLLARVLTRFIAFPFVAGLSYEIIKLSGKTKSFMMRLFIYPGLAMQKITTREPDDSQLEVAMAALEGLLNPGMSEYSSSENGFFRAA